MSYQLFFQRSFHLALSIPTPNIHRMGSYLSQVGSWTHFVAKDNLELLNFLHACVYVCVCVSLVIYLTLWHSVKVLSVRILHKEAIHFSVFWLFIWGRDDLKLIQCASPRSDTHVLTSPSPHHQNFPSRITTSTESEWSFSSSFVPFLGSGIFL